jgi:tRNA nucleotidyltransferase (CCA-adding enzyme)
MTALRVPPGPRIGRLLAAIQLARAEAKIGTAAEALQLAAELIDRREC